ncbi:MAG: tRNA (adenosine(37)-N6)-threonylcarbamoyltransferase complex ATPase subunit type 1 TsaE [Burkholderiaceae bacterium]|nr:tRNA (adenosine(37)-N6)-threonylcarbamoyltransferase complex ATPase subunit type 1 TsaE [Burkholderiaceae bacterium]
MGTSYVAGASVPFSSEHFTQFSLANEAATARLGAALGRAIGTLSEPISSVGLVIGLSGELGAGKTALVRAVLRRLGVSGPVKSPTFSLLELYSISRLNFYHFDFYRFSEPGEFAASGFRDFFGPGAVCAIEWPERAQAPGLPIDLRIELQINEPGRNAIFDALTQLGQECLQETDRAWRTSQDETC